MNKILILVITLVLNFNNIIPVNADGVILEYIVTIDNPETHMAHIQLTIDNIPKNIDIMIFELENYSHLDKKYVNNLIVTSKKGYIKSSFKRERGKWTCKITTENSQTLSLEYQTEHLITDPGGDYESYIGNELGIIIGHFLFLLPKVSVSTIRIKFELPDK